MVRRFVFLFLLAAVAHAAEGSPTPCIEEWETFEASFHGPGTGNPFVDIALSATFSHGSESFEAPGFYDGGSTFRIRFMPDSTGTWTFTTKSNAPSLAGQSGTFNAIAPGPSNHGPVGVGDRFHFIYADGTSYREIGTTCYAWIHQSEALQRQTLNTLAVSPFNKIRMCIFPKWYDYNRQEPAFYPMSGGRWPMNGIW